MSGAATALAGIRRAQSQHLLLTDVDAGAGLEARISPYLSSLRVVRLAAMIAAVSTATLLANDLSDTSWWAITIGGLGSAILVLLIEAKAIARAAVRPQAFLERFATPLALMTSLIRPLTRLLPLTSEAALSRSDPHPSEKIDVLQELRSLGELLSPRDAEEELHEDQRKMIRAVLALHQSTVKEIMVPRTDFTALSVTATFQEVLQLLVTSGRSRIPLYAGTIDSTVGVLYAKDVLSLVDTPSESFDIRQIARDPYFVPETKKVRELLQDFRGENVHFALVVDEYGGVEGLVSLNDILEEIVGEIEDEFEAPEQDISLIGEREAIIDGAVPIDEVNEALKIDLEGNGFETIGGFVLHHMGRIPKAGEELETDGIAIEVLATVRRRVRKIRIRKLDPVKKKEK